MKTGSALFLCGALFAAVLTGQSGHHVYAIALTGAAFLLVLACELIAAEGAKIQQSRKPVSIEEVKRQVTEFVLSQVYRQMKFQRRPR